MACLASTQIIRACLMDLASSNRELCKALLEELAIGLVHTVRNVLQLTQAPE